MRYLDLFSGAGGLSEGFINSGFTPIAHVEIDKHACKTIETRLIYHKLKKENNLNEYYDYLLGKMSRSIFIQTCSDKSITNSILNLSIGDKNNNAIFKSIECLSKGKKIDLIIGGPPCQAYSIVGRSRDKNGMKDDPRNLLYREYARYLKRFTPKIFVFENVLGLITAENGSYFSNMQSYFKRVGYELDYSIQNSENFGVLQKRRRIILIGWKKGTNFSYPEFSKIEINSSIKDILSDLKKLKPGEENNITNYRKKASNYLDKFKIRNGTSFVTQHVARPNNERDLEIYSIAINKWLNEKERLKYPDLPDRLKTHKNEKSFVDRFKVVDLGGLSHTMVAHIAKDGHHYIYPDSKQVRSISVREAARIQSFPDDFFFEGGRSAAFRQIGNAVPPLMAKEIANSIKKLI